MIFSKSNIIRNNTIVLTVGTLSSGVVQNVLNPDFSKNIVSVSSTLSVEVRSVGSSQYVALHGLLLPIGTVVRATALNYTKEFTVTGRNKNIVFYNDTPQALGNLTISFIGAGQKIISFIQAGLSTVIDWGTSSGQLLPYLSNNVRERVAITSRGLPTTRLQVEETPRLSLNLQNMTKAWAESDLIQIYNQYNTIGILSILDYELDDKPDHSYAAFELSSATVKTHSQTTTLVDVNLSFRAVA